MNVFVTVLTYCAKTGLGLTSVKLSVKDAIEVNQVCKIFGTITSFIVFEKINQNKTHRVSPAAAGTPRDTSREPVMSCCSMHVLIISRSKVEKLN